jgi:acyl-CoA synthetase (AMP-forming)/AMP-acid ligase II
VALVLPKAVRRPLPTDGDGSWAQKVLELGLRRRYGMTGRACTYPLYHAAGINYAMAANRVGAASILMRKIDPEAVLRLIETHRVTHAKFVPTMFVRMLKLPEAVRPSYDVSSLQCVIHAAAPCPVDVKHRMMKWLGPIIHEYYRGTDGFAGSTIGPEEWLAHPGSVGKPFSAVHVVGDESYPSGILHTGTRRMGGRAQQNWHVRRSRCGNAVSSNAPPHRRGTIIIRCGIVLCSTVLERTGNPAYPTRSYSSMR